MLFEIVCSATEKLSLAELRSATSCLETVFLTLFHSRVTRQETSALQSRSVLSICLQQCSGNAVTNSTSLTGSTAALHIYQYVKLINVLSGNQGLTYDQLQGLQTEVFVDISFINGDLTSTRY